MVKLVPVSQQLFLTAVTLSCTAQNPGALEGVRRDQPGSEAEETGIPAMTQEPPLVTSFIQSDSIRFCLKLKSTADKYLGSRMFLKSPHPTP